MITIITVNHDAHKFIDLCVRATHLYTKYPYKHVVIDNGSKFKTIDLLKKFEDKGWIELVRRNVFKGSCGHANSLNWYLQNNASERVCLLDSDAHPSKDGWLERLVSEMEYKRAVAIGFPHFRDNKLLHPACMLFEYYAYRESQFPSFNIVENGGVFYDTAMVVCEAMRKRFMIVPYGAMGKLVRHRWSGTRVERVFDFLDGIPLCKFNEKTAKWFQEASARCALEHD